MATLTYAALDEDWDRFQRHLLDWELVLLWRLRLYRFSRVSQRG